MAEPRWHYEGAVFLAILVVLEIGVLYLLIAVESPLTPIVEVFLRNMFGLFALVLMVATVLGFLLALVFRVVRPSTNTADPPPAG